MTHCCSILVLQKDWVSYRKHKHSRCTWAARNSTICHTTTAMLVMYASQMVKVYPEQCPSCSQVARTRCCIALLQVKLHLICKAQSLCCSPAHGVDRCINVRMSQHGVHDCIQSAFSPVSCCKIVQRDGIIALGLLSGNSVTPERCFLLSFSSHRHDL